MNQEQLKAILAKIDEIVRLYNEEQEQVKEPALMSDDGIILTHGQEEYIRGQKDMAVIIEQAKKIEYVRGYKEGDKEGFRRGYETCISDGSFNSKQVEEEVKAKAREEGEAEGYQKGLKQGLEVAEEKAKVARGEGYNEALKAIGRMMLDINK